MICGDEKPSASGLHGGMSSHTCGLEEGHKGDHQCSGFAVCQVMWPNLYHRGKSEGTGDSGRNVPEPQHSGQIGKPASPTLTETLEDLQHTNNLTALVDARGLVCVLDVLNEYCKKVEDTIAGNSDSSNPQIKKWWSARVHIESCSNMIEMLWEAYEKS